jgi:DNA uptake protein ComE-like DNA-binding protein
MLLAIGTGAAPWSEPRADITGRWRINPDIATDVELRLLPGVGGERSRSIMVTRAACGHFTADSPLVDVPGLGPGLIRRWVESGLLDVPAGATGVRLNHEP